VFTLHCPNSWTEHRRWIAHCLLDRLALPVTLRMDAQSDWTLKVDGETGSIVLPDLFLGSLSSQDAVKGLQPQDPTPWCHFSACDFSERLPVLFGCMPNAWGGPITPGADLQLGVDVFGTAFWMMTRVEEFCAETLDAHDRFSAFQSLAWRNNFLMVPVVDEYMRLITALIRAVWPGLQLPPSRSFTQFLSHDVDDPYAYTFMPTAKAARLIAANAVKSRAPFRGLQWGAGLALSRVGIRIDDPCDTFDWLMDVSEQAGVSSAFYFIASDRSCALDANYDISDPTIIDLLHRIAERGHEVGLHPGYMTFRDPALLVDQVSRLRKGMQTANIPQSTIGSRMHYLRWDGAVTPMCLAKAGISYDSTLGYADHPGFRCGTCHPFKHFDAATGIESNLYIRPLIAMECTVLAKRYMNLGATPAAFDVFRQLKDRCRSVGGEFALLWHNSSLFSPDERALYSAIVAA
jgi:hypothetical protein